MGAFCVFGVTTEKAKERAAKKVRVTDKAGRLKPLSELTEEREKEAAKIFETMKPVQISPEFDAPQFCEEWLTVARKAGQIRGHVVMARTQKLDKKGNPMVSKRTKRPVIGWAPYVAQSLKQAA